MTAAHCVDTDRELKVISDFYDLMLYLTQRTEKFPRHHRYSLGAAIESRLHGILSLLIQAKYVSEKQDFLRTANLELEILRFQLRLAKDVQALSIHSHGFAARQMHAIGSQIGGWLKSRRPVA